MPAMAMVHYLPDDLQIEVRARERLLDAALRADIPHAHACGGEGKCSTCRVLVLDGIERCAPRTEAEVEIAQQLGFTEEMRLACQLRLRGDITARRLVLDATDVQFTDARRRKRATPVGDLRSIAVMFADIRSFTPLAEALLPYDVIYILRRCFTDVHHIVSRYGGHITAYMGDGVMAIFGLESPETAARDAVRAGLGMLEAVAQRTPQFEKLYDRSIELNIGIHWGEAIVGRIGSFGNAAVLTAVGDTVNVARRIEEANKQTGTRLLVSDAAAAQVGDAAIYGSRTKVELAGKDGRHTVVEVVDLR